MQPIVLNSGQPFDLVSRVPSEFRCVIYERLLVAHPRLWISLPSRRATRPYTVINLGPQPNMRLAITLVSKAVTKEVLPIIYGNNKFEFENAQTLAHCLSDIGRNVVHLRRIGLAGALGKTKEEFREKRSIMDVIDLDREIESQAWRCGAKGVSDDCFCPREKYMTPERREVHAKGVKELIREGVAKEVSIDLEG